MGVIILPALMRKKPGPTMKFALTVLSILATASHLNAYMLPSVGTGALAKELQDFVNLVPIDKVLELTQVYQARDKEFQWIMTFLQSDDMKGFVEDVEDLPEYKTLMKYLLNQGLDGYTLMKDVKESMAANIEKTNVNSNLRITGGIAGYVKDVSEVISVYNMLNLFEYKVATSEVFKNFLHEILSLQYENLYTSTFTNPHFQRILVQLNYLYVDSNTFHTNFFTFLIAKALIIKSTLRINFNLLKDMNPQIMIVTMVAAASVAFFGFLAYRIRVRSNDPDLLSVLPLEDNSSLDEDLKDILAFVPIKEVQRIIERYMEYDPQIGDTVSFVNDQKRFILREFQNMPEANKLINFLRQNGLDVDSWQEKIRCFWKMSPKFIKYDPSMAAGGLTVMINKILETMPLDELHELLRQKVKYSASFRRFLYTLRSKDYLELCNAIETNDVLHHHYFWAKEGGLEITFAIELFNELHAYLTQALVT
ncbi:uncharacterized protein LOC117235223 [Bombus vosnesenskii]|uniref:Uncharacterized protein LOC117235223 n=1 Tax=Bombus vosnesenskii TaxID=207650 RepID=A0A6J3KIH6_9HYME|nr:uncharacterized protein LOC117235223 [Bombus vosnesenskii]